MGGKERGWTGRGEEEKGVGEMYNSIKKKRMNGKRKGREMGGEEGVVVGNNQNSRSMKKPYGSLPISKLILKSNYKLQLEQNYPA